MKGLDKAKRDRRKGVLTVEASIILPLFIMVITFVLNVMNLFYFHLVMQQAVQNVGLTLAQYGYVIDRVVDLNTFTLQEETAQKEDAVAGGVNKLIDDGRTMINLLENFEVDKLGEILNSGKAFGQDAEALLSTLESVEGKDIINYLIVSAMNEAGGEFVRWMIGDYISEMGAGDSTIQNIEYDLFIETGTKDFIIVVEYDYEMPFFGTKPLRFQQVVRVHPWVGGTTDGLYDSMFK